MTADDETPPGPYRRTSRRTRIAAAVVGALTASAIITATAVHEAHGRADRADTCGIYVEEDNVGFTQRYRAVASCAYIRPGIEVRGILDVPLYPDEQTPWFTTYAVHYTAWSVSPTGAEPKARFQSRPTRR